MKKKEQEAIYVGDKVRFNSKRGVVEGTVTEVKYRRPGSRSKFAKLYNLPTPTVQVFTVAPSSGKGAWTVNASLCTRVGKGDLGSASAQVSALRSQIFQAEDKRRSENLDTANNRGLLDLKRGDDIEVQFRGAHWVRCKFMKLSGANMVGYYRDGDFKFDALGFTKEPRVRFCAPEYVRPLKKEIA